MLKGLYGITDTKLTPYDKVLYLVELALKGGMKILQLRDKDSKTEELVDIAKKLKELCHRYNAYFIIDDRLELAKLCDADGLHIGEDDVSLKEAKKALGEKIIGVSCYGFINRAIEAQNLGASYVAFGSFFPSPTKPSSKLVSMDILREAKKRLTIPICAIGGIDEKNCKSLIDSGSDMIAVISNLWNSNDVYKKAVEFSKFFN